MVDVVGVFRVVQSGAAWSREWGWGLVLTAARYPRRGAGMTELFPRGCDEGVCAGLAGLFCARVAKV